MNLLKIFVAFLLMGTVLVSCDKKDSLGNYGPGSAPALTASSSNFAVTAADSTTKSFALSWTDPNYASNGPANTRYIIELDSATRNFSAPQTVMVVGQLSDSILAKDLNAIMLSLGFKINMPGTMEIRVKSSYNNYNETLISNVVSVSMTAYKIPPKVVLPASGHLFLVGDASQGGWNNPVPVPDQEFAQLDETTFAGVFNLNGGKNYLVLPVNGDWGHKYAVSSASAPVSGGDFDYDLSSNFNGPATSGWYTITLDFQAGRYTVTPFTGVLPSNLFLVGDATLGGWNNPVPVPSQQFTRVNSSVWTITASLNGGKNYLMLPVNGDWSHKYAVANANVPASGGAFGYDLSTNFNGPATDGTYTITANFVTSMYSVQ